jgi:hypothetical protein
MAKRDRRADDPGAVPRMAGRRLVLAAASLAIAAGVVTWAVTRDGRAPETPLGVDLDSVPAVDLSRHTVPLDRVVFDTFDGGYVRLSEATDAVIRSLRDRIRPIYRPRYGEPADLPWLEDDDLVVGYLAAGAAYAYPVKVLNFREVVNDEIASTPIAVTYCPLCGSGVVYDRRVEGRTLLFGNTSALYESDLVMFDHQTGSYWFQVAGDAIVGELSGTRLRALPSATVAWESWRRLHPKTRLLVGDGDEQFGNRYASDPFAGYAASLDEERSGPSPFAFPVSEERLDRRLPLGAVVIAVEAGGTAKAYPVGLMGQAAVNDVVGGRPVLVLSGAEGAVAFAFGREARGQTLTFELSAGGELRDRETGTHWDAAGRALSGPLRGATLAPLPLRRALWFSIAIALPGIELYRP